ncbi:hypothetical protein GALMADRAFT_243406 [Galerina marginata CBS 339.88]|uniref:F-box domain-containing protein n=1 Tax=Galerina marginata (strain CBS 339.88) TaxID=685588 RepID=A0A067T857_GALM3|nr:hypothetical protein GALMADRAFT_243406 [Galerina marginata CBS 339.88]
MYASCRNQEFASSPIARLPVELLSEIFSLCTLAAGEPSPGVENGNYSPPVITTETVQVPIILSSVNRRWRAVVLGQSTLWSNLCITAELIRDSELLDDGTQRTSKLNATQITSHLQRSRQASLNILIDARDPEWNFSEVGVGIDFGDGPTLPALFSSEHMTAAVSLLVPHISRWKSLTILTDTWAPMHAALSTINPSITAFGAPRLESMTLMRCNDFVSFSHQFQPRDLKEPLFLSRGSCSADTSSPLLPNLKHLSLRGVHVDWDSLGDALAAARQMSGGSLTSLELTSHCSDVRPSIAQFHKLLTSTPNLRTLMVTGSGPEIPDELDDVPRHQCDDKLEPVHLPQLQDITIGYRTALEGRTILKFLDAPNSKTLVLEDATYPAYPGEVNGGSMLNFLGSKEFVSRSGDNDTPSQSKEPSPSRAAFPLLEHVTLKSVKSTPRPLRTFFSALPRLHHLELVGMSMQAVYALVPSSLPTSTCPCPQLRSLCIRDSEHLQVQDLDFIVGDLAVERENRGACGLREVDIHVDSARAARVASAASPGTKVNIISDDEDEEEDYMDEDLDMDNVDPFKPGGAFNDPVFDEYYSTQVAAR